MTVFVIEDELHAEWQGEFSCIEDALTELHRRASIPWNQPPNLAPCSNAESCGRSYEIIEYDQIKPFWEVVQRLPVFEIDRTGIKWAPNFGPATTNS